jgi:hypothetical protein
MAVGQTVPGTWNVPLTNIKIPDLGITEMLGAAGNKDTSNANNYNPNVYAVTGKPTAPVDMTGITPGMQTSTNPNTNNAQGITATINNGSGGAPPATQQLSEADRTGRWVADGNVFTNKQDYLNYVASKSGGGNQMSDAMMQQMNADINSASSGYDAIKAQLEAGKGDFSNAYNTGLSDVNNQVTQSQGMADLNRTQLQNQGSQQKASTYQNYQTSQRQNREAARAAGAGESSAYLDTQGQTNNSYGQTLAGITTNLTNQIGQIDLSINSLNQNAENAKQKLANTYTSGIRDIVLKEGDTDTQKANAVAQIRAQHGSQMAQLQQYQSQLQQQMELAREQMDNQLQVAKTYASNYSSAGYNQQNTTIPSTQANAGGGVSNPWLMGSTDNKLNQQ